MNIQPFGQTGARILQRQDLAPGPLGTVGNQRFTPQQDGTAPVSPISPVSNIYRAWANLRFAISGAPLEELELQDQAIEAGRNSRLIGDLLGHLTAPADEAKARVTIAQKLTQLCELCKGSLVLLPGGREALSAYLSELVYVDLIALYSGVLGHPDARRAVLDQVGSGLRRQAAGLLRDVADAVKLRLAQEVVLEPLWEIAGLLFLHYPDPQKLETQLIKLHTRLAMLDASGVQDRTPALHLLDVYFKSLPQDQSDLLLSQLHAGALDAARAALLIRWEDWKTEAAAEKKKNDPLLAHSGLRMIKFMLSLEEYEPLTMLNHLRTSLERDLERRTAPSLRELNRALRSAVHEGDQLAASEALFDLHALVNGIQTTYRRLPEATEREVRRQIEDSLTLFRDIENNPDGELSADSLRRLDDLTFGRLRRAVSLHSLGLELNHEAAVASSLHRVRLLSRQLTRVMTDVFRTLSKEQVDMPLLTQQLRDAAGVESQRTRRLEGLGHFNSNGPTLGSRWELARESCGRVVDELLRARKVMLVSSAMRNRVLIREMASRYFTTAYKLESATVQSGYEQVRENIVNEFLTIHLLLNGVSGAMLERLKDLNILRMNENVYERWLEQELRDSVASRLPGILYPVLQEQYGVIHDSETDTVELQ